MRTVWILGAGASRAEHREMPLVDDFMKTASDLGRFDGPRGQRLLNSIRADFGYSKEQVLGQVSIEELLTLAACNASWLSLQNSPAQDSESMSRHWASFSMPNSLEYLIAGVLFHFQQEVFAKSEMLHDSLVSLMQGGDAVISYNYDLLIDRALWKAGKASSADYAVPFKRSLDAAHGGSSTLEEYEAETSRGVSLLKLHGSLNWLCLKHHDVLEPTEQFQSLKDSVFYLRDAFRIGVGSRFFWGRFNVRCAAEQETGLSFVELTPVIVAPNFDKRDAWSIRGGAIRRLWELAQKALQDCTRVVIIGHSLRDADYQTRWLLRTALVANDQRPTICIVNPNEKDRAQLRQFFGSLGSAAEFATIEQYLKGEQA